jgi:hypothetical protein
VALRRNAYVVVGTGLVVVVVVVGTVVVVVLQMRGISNGRRRIAKEERTKW